MFHILVAEDDPNTRKLMCAVLKRSGFEVSSAENGVEALEVMDRQHIDLIVLDIMMPEMDGYELTRELRSAEMNVPILMVSARQEAKDKRLGFRLGTDDYMTKPVRRRWFCAFGRFCAGRRLPTTSACLWATQCWITTP